MAARLTLLITVVAVVRPAPAQEPAEWPTPATLIDDICVDAHFDCEAKPIRHRPTMAWDTAHTKRRMIVPTAKVRLGPFFLTKQVERRSGTNHPSAGFSITVWARSPALYVDGQYQGAEPQFIKIGDTSVVLNNADDHEEKTVYVSATLPGVFTAVQITATISGGGNYRFPTAGCTNLPASATNPGALDQPCLQVAINPLMLLVPKVVPLAILYEPPGNCAWSNLTNSHTAGTALTVEEATSTSTRTLTDVSILGSSIDHQDFTEQKDSVTQRKSQVYVSRSQSFGTALGLPLNSPGNPECNNPNVAVPPRPTAGPGNGDVFIFLYEPSLLYWDTANLTNFLFTDFSAPDYPRRTFVATAAQIASGQGLPPGISFTAAERQAILDLDPFTAPGWTTTTLPERFVFLNQILDISQGLAIEQNESQHRITAGMIKTAVAQATTSGHDNEDFWLKVGVRAVNFGGGLAAKAAAGAALAWMATQWADPNAMGFPMADSALKAAAVPALLSTKDSTTITTTYSRSNALERTDETAITQAFYIKDTNVGMNVAMFYDALFGTFAFVPWPGNMGVAVQWKIRRLPAITWPLTADARGALLATMPDDVRTKITRAGGTHIARAAAAQYRVAERFTRGAPTSFGVDLRTRRASGRIPADARGRQALFLVLNAREQPVAQLWITFAPRQP